MSYKGLALAAAAALGAFGAFSGANAGPVPAGVAAQGHDTAITQVHYNYRGDDRYSDGPDDRPPALLAIPAEVIGGVLGIVTGVLGAPFEDSGYEGTPYYGVDGYNNGQYFGAGAYPPYYYYDDGGRYYGNGGYSAGYYGNGGYTRRYRRYYGNGGYTRDYDDRQYYENGGYARGYDAGPYYGGGYASGYPYYRSDGYGSDGYREPYYRSGYGGGEAFRGSYDRGYERSYEEGGVAACQRNFRSFDPASGTYINANGVEVVCPYLDR